ncbi:hypothetical protein ACIF6L_09735 [Kitasatospora sp. NPDC086009]|uniref:hypothetical protein n=1 Tax=unclassified Kitasatospora TaxID=2633591 RepID=UPI0037C555BB
MRLSIRLLAGGAAAALIAVAAGASTVFAASGNDGGQEIPPVAVEDFSYPQADKVFALTGLTLKGGDGHIVLADCGPADLIEVTARTRAKFCFQVTGDSGSLTMDVAKVTSIKSTAYNVRADMTLNGTGVTFNVPKSPLWTEVGEPTDPQRRDHSLVKITATK